MPKFCPECGSKLPTESAKFCSECGYNLTSSLKASHENPPSEVIPSPPSIKQETVSEEKPVSIPPQRNVYDLGTKLEEVVEQIFQKEGYETQRRVRFPGRGGGYTHEIDIVARKKNEKLAIECKNYGKPLGIDKVRDFSSKLNDMPEWRGIIIAYSDLTSDAQSFAESSNIDVWESDSIMERWWAISVGRTSLKGEKLNLEYALPINHDFTKATSIDLKNKQFITVKDAKLVFHPYCKFDYQFSANWHDPSKELHKFRDSGSVVIDMLDCTAINPKLIDTAGKITHVLTKIVSKSARSEGIRKEKLLHEILNQQITREYSLTVGEDYTAVKINSEVSISEAKRAAIEYIIQKNTHTVTYTSGKGGNFSINTKQYIPDRNDIKSLTNSIVYVPKWNIHFSAFGSVYSREAFACSGILLEDTIKYCPKHAIGGLLGVQKKNVAVCEECGRAYCDAHIKQCPICNKWLCETHGVVCSSCTTQFCSIHAPLTCSVCNSSLCEACASVCPICGQNYGKNYAQKCDQCGKPFCEKCIITSGLIRKTRLCKNCAKT